MGCLSPLGDAKWTLSGISEPTGDEPPGDAKWTLSGIFEPPGDAKWTLSGMFEPPGRREVDAKWDLVDLGR